MADDLPKKLQVKPGARLWFINVPEEFASEITASGDVRAVKSGAAFDGAIAFCNSPGDVADYATRILAKIPHEGPLWFAYRKGATAKASGLSRDTGWAPLIEAGWTTVRSISFDDIWTGLRFRPETLVKPKQ